MNLSKEIKLLTRKEAFAYLKIGSTTFWKMEKEGLIKPTLVYGGQIKRYSIQELNKLMIEYKGENNV